jgi:hypothetical protein
MQFSGATLAHMDAARFNSHDAQSLPNFLRA